MMIAQLQENTPRSGENVEHHFGSHFSFGYSLESRGRSSEDKRCPIRLASAGHSDADNDSYVVLSPCRVRSRSVCQQ